MFFARAELTTATELALVAVETKPCRGLIRVRDQLASDDTHLYDAGVMLARLHLCLRVVTAPSAEETPWVLAQKELYAKELGRVVPIADGMMAAAVASPALMEALEPDVRVSLASLSGQLTRWDGGSARWCRAATSRANDVFASMGAVARNLSSAPEVNNETDEAAEALVSELPSLEMTGGGPKGTQPPKPRRRWPFKR